MLDIHYDSEQEASRGALTLKEKKMRVTDVLRLQKLAVMATAGLPSPDRCYPSITHYVPESALVAFAEDDKLNLYFQTGRHTRKATNLVANPYISFVMSHTVGNAHYPNITIQYQGKAQQLHQPEELVMCKQLFVTKDSPTTETFFNDPRAIFFKVEPVWIGFSDYSIDPPCVLEIDFHGVRSGQ